MEEEMGNTDGLDDAAVEPEALRSENESLARDLKLKEKAIARLEQTLAEKDSEIAVSQQTLAETERELSEIGKQLSQAVAAYREMVVKANPGVLAELITGETVEEVDESLKNARAVVDRVRQEMEAEAAKARIPAGAPQRVPLDLSALSSREKIQYAIGGSS